MDFGDIKCFKERKDFSLENRHLICISNKEFLNKNVIILFYKKSEKKDKPIYDIFGKVGNSLKLVNLQFVTCAVDSISGLEKTFHEITNDPDHPYYWIRNKPKNDDSENRFPFLLVYRKGFPQCFYEGAFDEKIFRDFCLQISVKSEYTQFISMDVEDRRKQQWFEYRPKEREELKAKPVLDAFDFPSHIENINSLLPKK